MTSAINDAIPVAGTLIDATAIRDNFVTAKSEVSALQTAKLAANGTVNPSANQPMAGFKHTGVAAASAAGQYVEYSQAYAMASLGKSAIVNGNFSINQRAVSGTVTLAAGVYGHDRWKAGAGGCTYTFTTTNGITTVTITAGSLMQTIRAADVPIGLNTCVLSWAGTAQGRFGVGSYGASGLTASVVGNVALTVEFNTGTLSLVQLELGSVATPYRQRPDVEELNLCQVYYESITSVGTKVVGTGLVGTGNAIILMTYSYKRIPPVFTFSTGWTIYDGVVNSVATLIAQTTSLTSAQLRFSTASLTAGNGAMLISDSTGQTIKISAEE